ncbi:MAG: hypothetical protein R3E39_23760 [Anaerolineae bacterium]
MMDRKVAYVIKPNDALLDVLKPHAVLWFYYSDTRVWVFEEGGRQWLTPEDMIIGVKLLFLADFRTTAMRSRSSEMLMTVDMILGNEPYGVHIFDKWWTLDSTSVVEEFKKFRFRFLPKALKRIAPTGIANVDTWLAQIEERLH